MLRSEALSEVLFSDASSTRLFRLPKTGKVRKLTRRHQTFALSGPKFWYGSAFSESSVLLGFEEKERCIGPQLCECGILPLIGQSITWGGDKSEGDDIRLGQKSLGGCEEWTSGLSNCLAPDGISLGESG